MKAARLITVIMVAMFSFLLQGCDRVVSENRFSKEFYVVSLYPGTHAYAHIRDSETGVDHKNVYVGMFCYESVSNSPVGSVITVEVVERTRESGRTNTDYPSIDTKLCI